MSTLFDGFSANTVFPDHDWCFGDPSNASSICQIPTDTMIRFLNISSPSSYLDVYCANPPVDSCSFGYCPNPDVASPAVRYSTYFSSLVSAILVLYSPEDRDRAHTRRVAAQSLSSSCMSSGVFWANRRVSKPYSDLECNLNRALGPHHAALMASVLSFTALPTSVWQFQQAACDTEIASNHVASLFFLPFIIFFEVYPYIGVLIIATVAVSWGIAIWRLRQIIWAKHDRYLPLGRLRKVVNRYPFIQFYSMIVLPHAFWIFNIEIGLQILSTRESFSATYGQARPVPTSSASSRSSSPSPPFIQLCIILPRIPNWFIDLAWVRLLTGRRNQPFRSARPQDESALPMQQDPHDPTRAGLLTGDAKVDGLPLQMDELDMKVHSGASSRSASYM
ncbi:hypothetical protein B0H14DRAFT_3474247 [Mycena olivaceomarginata]|nr:hypothetical protein B0H14DRAFT_3474247 [Mycena olivaceomarginata]